MLYSMTGYGKAEGQLSEGRQLQVELKSLNGKNFDLINRFPTAFRSYETQIRKLLQEQLQRGSIDISLTLKQHGGMHPVVVNKEMAGYYFQAMQAIASSLALDASDDNITLQTLMSLPEVVVPEVEGITEEEWEQIKECIATAASRLMHYRQEEGAAIETDLLQRVRSIEDLLSSIAPLEQERIERIKARMDTALEKLDNKLPKDENRFEQELIYYLEKIDFSEEKQRLSSHCRYFQELLSHADEKGMGKKLGFVLQEMGREINTLGSKAHDAVIQKIVVNMKDELEKAKEQILNVL